jgi:hypothetical protein
MRKMDLRITELSEYLNISRVTLYKYINMYERGTKDGMDLQVRNLFDYIEKTPNIGKRNVMNWLLVNIVEQNDNSGDLVSLVNQYQSSDSRSDDKIKFLNYIILRSEMDSLIPYFNSCMDLLAKESLSDNEIIQLSKFVLFREDVTTNKTVTVTKIKETKKILKLEEKNGE